MDLTNYTNKQFSDFFMLSLVYRPIVIEMNNIVELDYFLNKFPILFKLEQKEFLFNQIILRKCK